VRGGGPDPVRVVLLCPDEVFLRGLAGVLGDDPELAVVGEATSVADALARFPALRPDVAVVDVPAPDVTEVCRRMRTVLPRTGTLALQAPGAGPPDGPPGAGLVAALRKPVRGRALTAAVHAVAAGAYPPPAGPAGAVPPRRQDVGGDRLSGLTERERAVLRLIGEGLTNRQIADRMGLAEKTVKNYTSHLLAKLGLERRTQAAILATRLQRPDAPV
jgi:two-component system, NarL family, response regulator DevR